MYFYSFLTYAIHAGDLLASRPGRNMGGKITTYVH